MSSNGVDSQEIDFEDVIAQFEGKIKSRKERTSPGRSSSAENEHVRHNIAMDMTDFEPDLQILCEALMEHIKSNSEVLRKSSSRDTPWTDQAHLDSGVIREVFRTEIKETLTQMKGFRESELEEPERLSVAEGATINSLRRQVRERDEQLKAIKQKLKYAQIVKHRLEDSVKGHQAVVTEYENSKELLENEIGELQKQNAALTKRCSDADVRHRRDSQEKERLNATLTQFRREVMVAHQNALKARTDAKQAKKQNELLEARAAEANANSSAVSMRIKELKEIQEQMVAIMRGVQESGHNTATRGVMAHLAEQRSRLVGKIANLLTRKKKQEEDSQQAENPAQTNSLGSSGESSSVIPHPNSLANNTSPPSVNSTQPNSADRLSKKQRFESFRQFGNDITRIATGRNSRRVVMENVEKTCEAVEKDTEALREIIERKQGELQRMEAELAEAIDRAQAFEMDLQKERQKNKLENRNMKNPDLDEALAQMRTFTTTRRKSTLFEWQSQKAKKETKEEKEGTQTIITGGVTIANNKIWSA